MNEEIIKEAKKLINYTGNDIFGLVAALSNEIIYLNEEVYKLENKNMSLEDFENDGFEFDRIRELYL